MDYNYGFPQTRKTDTRDKHENEDALCLSDINERFDNNIKDIKKLFTITEALVQKGDCEQANDIWRSQLVFLESALDTYFHDLLLYAYVDMYMSGPDSFTQAFKNLKVPLFKISLARRKRQNMHLTLDDRITNIIRNEIKYSTFMSDDRIAEACSALSISYYDYSEYLPKLKEIATRRNEIVHQTDRKSNAQERTQITEEKIKEYITIVCDFQQTIHSKYAEKCS